MALRWREAMSTALYGPDGFFVSGPGPVAHFRTSVHASPVFSSCLLRLLSSVDAALGHPARLDVVDVGAGRGELLRSLSVALRVSGEPAAAPLPLAERVRLVAVEKAPRPDDLPAEIEWVDEIPQGVTGLLVATEWLDNVPLDLAVHTPEGWRYLLVDPATGEESTGDPVDAEDADWLDQWWPAPAPAPTPAPAPAPAPASIKKFASGMGPESDANFLINGVGGRGEVGRSRDEAWAAAITHLDRGVALAVDYGHLREGRPAGGTMTGYRGGRQVAPVPDGSCDVTAHVAVDSVASAGERVARCAYTLVSQREGLRALGADGGRPPLSLASRDPAGYVRALAAASAVAELTDPAGLGGHWWLLQPVGVTLNPLMAR
ncbi:SAM-dependent methyltransferase [Micromonospora chaiyaphumensis]|uniref:SAM-dependent methyltransferase, MidA family n=1 Tax=Micromonospora chaiyaphumensis TaxID=307119 RepID=A0A1C4YFA6_9ACTN|nr:SAM-dependent methyltransferase [Micromonospora chaiyaphumensis]SCF19405.1 SAM-dependent methyltransferase, MidA family [Micromonospora chaiyaphumensis]